VGEFLDQLNDYQILKKDTAPELVHDAEFTKWWM
jgi:hypothetical protein